MMILFSMEKPLCFNYCLKYTLELNVCILWDLGFTLSSHIKKFIDYSSILVDNMTPYPVEYPVLEKIIPNFMSY